MNKDKCRTNTKKLSKEACTQEVFDIFEDINIVVYLPISHAMILKIQQTNDEKHELLIKIILEGWPWTKEITPLEITLCARFTFCPRWNRILRNTMRHTNRIM